MLPTGASFQAPPDPALSSVGAEQVGVGCVCDPKVFPPDMARAGAAPASTNQLWPGQQGREPVQMDTLGVGRSFQAWALGARLAFKGSWDKEASDCRLWVLPALWGVAKPMPQSVHTPRLARVLQSAPHQEVTQKGKCPGPWLTTEHHAGS